MFGSPSFGRFIRLAGRIAGTIAFLLAGGFLSYSLAIGGHIVIGGTEINLRDPLLMLNKCLGLVLLGFFLWGKGNFIIPILRCLGTRKGMLALWAGVFFAYSSMSLIAHYFHSDTVWDYAIFESYMFHIARYGQAQAFVSGPISMFSDHLFFVFYPYAVIYGFLGVNAVMVLHKLLLSTAVPFAWLLCREIGHDEKPRGLAALTAALAPSFFRLGVTDLYPEVLIFPLGLALAWAFHGRKWPLFALFALAMVLVREDGGFILGFMGVYFAIHQRNWRWLFLTLLGLGVSFGLMEAQASVAGYYPAKLTSRYGIRSLFDIAGLLRLLIRASNPVGFVFFMLTVLPFGLPPFLRVRYLVPAYISAIPHLASAYFRQAQLRGVNAVFLYPLIFLAFVHGLRKIKEEHFNLNALLILSLLFVFGDRWLRHRVNPAYAAAAAKAISMIPSEKAVVSTPCLANRLGGRDTLYILPGVRPDIAEYVLLEETDIYYRDSCGKAIEFLREKGYREVFSGEGIHLLECPPALKTPNPLH
ncbi:MAG: DUF2079 domain-containing protein [candidate division WOR-3 bacterium]